MRFLIAALAFGLFSFSSPAYAQCSAPYAEMGVLIFNKDHRVMQYCDGEKWVGIWGGGGGGTGTGEAGGSLPACSNGELPIYLAGSWQCTNGSSIDNLNAANIKSGRVAPARLGTGSASNTTYLRGDGAWVSLAQPDLNNLNASNLTSGTIPAARFPSALPAISGANLTNLNASNLASGTVPVARLGASGTRSSATFLRGDNTWAAPASGGQVTAIRNYSSSAGAGNNVTSGLHSICVPRSSHDSTNITYALVSGPNAAGKSTFRCSVSWGPSACHMMCFDF